MTTFEPGRSTFSFIIIHGTKDRRIIWSSVASLNQSVEMLPSGSCLGEFGSRNWASSNSKRDISGRQEFKFSLRHQHFLLLETLTVPLYFQMTTSRNLGFWSDSPRNIKIMMSHFSCGDREYSILSSNQNRRQNYNPQLV